MIAEVDTARARSTAPQSLAYQNITLMYESKLLFQKLEKVGKIGTK